MSTHYRPAGLGLTLCGRRVIATDRRHPWQGEAVSLWRTVTAPGPAVTCDACRATIAAVEAATPRSQERPE